MNEILLKVPAGEALIVSGKPFYAMISVRHCSDPTTPMFGKTEVGTINKDMSTCVAQMVKGGTKLTGYSPKSFMSLNELTTSRRIERKLTERADKVCSEHIQAHKKSGVPSCNPGMSTLRVRPSDYFDL